MSMVGTKSSLNMLASKAAQPASKAASSSSSSPFEAFLSQKRSSEENNSRLPEKHKSEPKKYVEPKKLNEQTSQANFPGQPKNEFVGKTPAQLESAPIGEARGDASRPEVQTPDAQSRAEKRSLDESVDNLQHRQALQGLLKKMKEEFGLDAEQVVQAFAQLTPQELAQPPEASLDKLIQSLPLSPEQQNQARLYFQQMLKDTASTDMAGYLKSSQRQLSLEVVSKKEARDREIQRSLEKMQSDFFTQPQPLQQQQQPAPVAMGKYKTQQANTSTNLQSNLMSAQQKPANNSDDFFMATGSMSSSLEGASLSAAGTVTPPSAEGSILTPKTNSGLPKQAPNFEMPKGEEVLLDEAVNAEATSSKEMAELPNLFEKEVTDLLTALDVPAADIAAARASSSGAEVAVSAPEVALASAMGAGQNQSSGRDDERSRQEKPDTWSAPVNQAGGQRLEQTNAQKPESFIVNTKPTPTEEAQNVKEVINRVQFLAGKGGGEMKITMSPEGLGEVTMKVAIQKGQVNVEMITESKEVKKLLEQGLGELKATLAANNLKVDQIRVDTPADVSRQLTQNHDDAQRQFAQQFMEQFRQDNNEWRRGFYDIPGAKNHSGQKEESERGPGVNSSDRRRDSSRRLDLVA